MIKEITISLCDKEYKRVMSVANKRRKSPASLCKHILLQLADNDEIEEVTGKRKSDSSVYKKQRYNNQGNRKREYKCEK